MSSNTDQQEPVTYQKDGVTYQRRRRREFTDEFKKQIVNLHNTGKRRENELIRLRREDKCLLMENDILKQAALILGEYQKK